MSETTSEPFLPTTVMSEDENDADTSSSAPTTINIQNTISTTIDPLKVLPLEHLNNSKTESPRDINVTIEANSQQETSSTSITTEASLSSASDVVKESVETATESTKTTTTTSKSNSSTMKLEEIANKMESKVVDKSDDNSTIVQSTEAQVAETNTQSTFVSSSSVTPSQQMENIDVTTTTTTTTSEDKSSKIEFSNNMQTTTTKAISENQNTKIDDEVKAETRVPDENKIEVTTNQMPMELSDDETELPVPVTPNNTKEGRAIDLSTVQVTNISNNNETTNATMDKEQSTENMLEAIKLSTTTEQSNISTSAQIPISVVVESTTIQNQREESTVDSVTHNNEHFDDEHSSRSHLDTERQQDIISDDICTKSGILYKVRKNLKSFYYLSNIKKCVYARQGRTNIHMLSQLIEFT